MNKRYCTNAAAAAAAAHADAVLMMLRNK